jgi:hypothetical protein
VFSNTGISALIVNAAGDEEETVSMFAARTLFVDL